MLIVENLVGFVATRPPAVIFIASVIVLTTAAFSVALYSRGSPLKDYNVKVDWNGVLGNLASLELCADYKNSQRHKPGTVARSAFLPPQQTVHSSSAKDGASTPKPPVSTEQPVGVSLKLKLGTSATELPRATTKLTGTFTPQDLGLVGVDKKHGNFTVSLDFGNGVVMLNCTLSSYCIPTKPLCVTFEGPTHLLPNVPETKKCELRQVSPEEVIALNVMRDSEDALCRGNVLPLEYWPDATMTPTLSPEDSALVSVHVMYTAYFLLAMAISGFVVALFKGRARKNTHTLADKATLVI